MVAPTDLREYLVGGRSTETPGRVLCSARTHHIIVDGPVQNGFPGEEITPPEAFLCGVAACGVELVQMFAIQQELPLTSVKIEIKAVLDRGNPVRTDYTVFNKVHLDAHVTGVSQEQGAQLVEAFTHRCPLFGSVAVATPVVEISVTVGD
ncbi:MAG TPA: OsmC family protein [Chloroflexia bacterium]|nr:OsmC family protein [Chloroflexia bacterium]